MILFLMSLSSELDELEKQKYLLFIFSRITQIFCGWFPDGKHHWCICFNSDGAWWFLIDMLGER